MKKETKYIFVFAGNWNQFRDWLRRTERDDTIFETESEHIVYVDRAEKWVGLPWEAYKNGEVRVIGTFYSEASNGMINELEALEARIDAARTSHNWQCTP